MQEVLQPTENKAIVVLCMHRSGSSLVAGILHYLGVDLGVSYFIKAASSNPRGFFEDSRFRWLNATILSCAGGAWNVNVAPELIEAQRFKFKAEIRRYVVGRRGVWGWKCPRTVLTYRLYEPYLENPHFVVVSRDDEAIAQSLFARNEIPIPRGVKFAADYRDHIADLLREFPSTPSILVHYDDILDSPQREIKRLADFVGLYGEVPSGFVGAELRHY